MARRRTWRALGGLALAFVVTLGAWIAFDAARLPHAEALRQGIHARRDPAAASTWVPLWAISDRLQTAVVVWEDPAFFHHGAINPPEILRAAWINLRAGGYERGASTITQQVVKNQFLGPEKTLRRKLREMILAHRLEQVLTKDEILTVYLNVAEWGEGVVGAEAAARRYFGKPAAQLDWAEAALLTGMLPNPRLRDPCSHSDAALGARSQVLAKLRDRGHLSEGDAHAAEAVALPRCAPAVAERP